MFGHQPDATAPPPRHAFGLPAGSVRALLALGVLGYLWLLVLTGEGLANKEASLAFIYLQALMLLILAHFFTAHNSTIGSHVSGGRSPLGLPAGSIRIILVAGYLGLAAYLYYHTPQFELPETGQLVVLPLVLLTAFFVGHVLTGVMKFVNRGTLPAWFQDFEAWVALIALFMLGIVVIIRTVVNRDLPLPDQVPLYYVEAGLAGAVGFYFGARW